MNKDCIGTWGYSFNEEIYYGYYVTAEDAIAELHGGRGWVGQFIAPSEPEGYIDGEDVIEHILCQDEYSGDYAEDAFDCSREVLDDLTLMLQQTFRDWMEKHGVEPGFLLVDPDTVRKVTN